MDTSSSERDTQRRRVMAARVARLATIDPEGQPSLVPCTFVLAADTGDADVSGGRHDVGDVPDVVYSAVDEKPKTTRELARLRNLEHHPRAAILVDLYDDDWSRLWWVRLRGSGRVLRDGAERDRALDLLARKYPQYRDARPRGPVIAIDIDEWRAWEATPRPA